MSAHPFLTALERGGFHPDDEQRKAVQQLSALYDELASLPEPGVLSRWLGGAPPAIKGIYLWGGVGRGKTHLADTLYGCLPVDDKLRLHFHRFMQQVHHQLRGHTATQNPLDRVGEHFAEQASVLFLDEMHITDITDAMLIHGLLQALFTRRVTLVTTSNLPPEDLYKDGLQRGRFLPAIALLREHTQVTQLGDGIDYRLRALSRAEIYHTPLNDEANAQMQRHFDDIAMSGDQREPSEIVINDRPIPVVRCSDGVAWFEFDALCVQPRASIDFIEIARFFHTVLLAGVPQMGPTDSDAARRFVNMIDEFYDRNVKLVVSAAVAPESLYTGERLVFEFERTASRLREMQTLDYLARSHLP